MNHDVYSSILDWVPKPILFWFLGMAITLLVAVVRAWIIDMHDETNEKHEEARQKLTILTASFDLLSKNIQEMKDSFLKMNFHLEALINSENHQKIVNNSIKEDLSVFRERLAKLERR